jgi:hypothetical protein
MAKSISFKTRLVRISFRIVVGYIADNIILIVKKSKKLNKLKLLDY